MRKLELKLGGHPLKNDDFMFIQTAYFDAFKAIISIFEPSLNVIMSGCNITENSGNITITSGSVAWQGEIFTVDSKTFPIVPGGQLFFKLIEEIVAPSPVTYHDQSTQNVHIDRKLELVYFTSGDQGEYLAAFTRTSSLGFKRGMQVDWVGNVNLNFDSTGLGINEMAGFALCNGNTFTISGGIQYTVPDKRGRKSVGASDMPAQGAPTYDTNLGTYPATDTGGARLRTILKQNLPNYNLTINDPGHSHTSQGQAGESDNANDRGVMLSNGSHQTSISQTNIVVSSGGSDQPIDIMNPYIVTYPVIKL